MIKILESGDEIRSMEIVLDVDIELIRLAEILHPLWTRLDLTVLWSINVITGSDELRLAES